MARTSACRRSRDKRCRDRELGQRNQQAERPCESVGNAEVAHRTPGAVASEDLAAIQLVCDQIALATERDQLLHPAARKHIALEAKPYRKLKIEPWTPARSRREWILAAARLGLE